MVCGVQGVSCRRTAARLGIPACTRPATTICIFAHRPPLLPSLRRDGGYIVGEESMNKARSAAGESRIENSDFLVKVRDELDDLGEKREIRLSTKPTKYYDLTEDQMRLVGMRESKAVRKWVT